MMDIKKEDLPKLENICIALRKGKQNDFSGEEALAFAQAYQWLIGIYMRILEQAKKKAESPVAKPVPLPAKPAPAAKKAKKKVK